MEIKTPIKFVVRGTAKVLTPEENAKLKEQEVGIKDANVALDQAALFARDTDQDGPYRK